METISTWKEIALNSLNTLGEQFSFGLSSIIGALLVLLIGWLIIKAVVAGLSRLLRIIKIDSLSDKLNDIKLFGEKSQITFKISSIITFFAKWLLWLIVLIIAADIMGWTFLTQEISNLIGLLPQIFSALALFLVGVYVANFVKKLLLGLFETINVAGATILANIVFYFLVVIISLTALNQGGIDTTIISQNVSILLGGLLLVFVLSFGLGTRSVVNKLTLAYYARRNFEPGTKIKYNGMEGEIASLDNIRVYVKTKDSLLAIPIEEFVNTKIEVLD